MFENTSKKIKICAYVFFIGSLLNQGTRDIRVWFQLGCPSDFIIETLLSTLNKAVMYFIIALFIYSFARIVEHFEKIKDSQDSI